MNRFRVIDSVVTTIRRDKFYLIVLTYEPFCLYQSRLKTAVSNGRTDINSMYLLEGT